MGANCSTSSRGLLDDKCATSRRRRRQNSSDSTTRADDKQRTETSQSKPKQQQQSHYKSIPIGQDLGPDEQPGADLPANCVTTDQGGSDIKAKLAKLKEGVDFIETEEDAKAVEAATLKIQSTFRGKKIRAKVPHKEEAATTTKTANEQQQQQEVDKTSKRQSEELCKKVAEMQVNSDNSSGMARKTSGAQQQANQAAAAANLPEDEVERAATKIQAGFKGYKTRKELEGKLGSAGAAGQLQETAASK